MAALSQNAMPKRNAYFSLEIRNSPARPIQIPKRNALLRIQSTGGFLVVFHYTRSEVRINGQVLILFGEHFANRPDKLGGF